MKAFYQFKDDLLFFATHFFIRLMHRWRMWGTHWPTSNQPVDGRTYAIKLSAVTRIDSPLPDSGWVALELVVYSGSANTERKLRRQICSSAVAFTTAERCLCRVSAPETNSPQMSHWVLSDSSEMKWRWNSDSDRTSNTAPKIGIALPMLTKHLFFSSFGAHFHHTKKCNISHIHSRCLQIYIFLCMTCCLLVVHSHVTQPNSDQTCVHLRHTQFTASFRMCECSVGFGVNSAVFCVVSPVIKLASTCLEVRQQFDVHFFWAKEIIKADFFVSCAWKHLQYISQHWV